MKCYLGLAAALFAGAVQAADVTIIHAGRLIDGVSDRARENVSIIVEGNTIKVVENGFRNAAAGEKLLDLRGYTVLPGLMDMHVHLSGEMSPKSYIEGYQLNPADYALRSVVYAERTLQAGFTTVRNPGDDDNVTISLRNAVRDGWVPGPRIHTAGKSIATTGGHADPSNGLSHYLRTAVGDPGPANGVINGPWEAAQAVRQRYQDGADFIKITATGGVLSQASSGQNPQFFEEEIRAVVETAKDYGFHVAAHAHGAEGMKRAIRAGVRSIEHGTFMDEEVIRLMKQHGTYYVPTVTAGKWVAEKAAIDGFFPDIVRPKAAAVGPLIEEAFARAYRAGVRIAFGTDTGVSAHGENAQEFGYMVNGGMPPMAAIKSATSVAAELLGVRETLGTVQAGKLADIIAVKGDPLADIGVLREVKFVMKEGVVYKSQ